eukprot:766916-Hanusia_phi.AAC.2
MQPASVMPPAVCIEALPTHRELLLPTRAQLSRDGGFTRSSHGLVCSAFGRLRGAVNGLLGAPSSGSSGERGVESPREWTTGSADLGLVTFSRVLWAGRTVEKASDDELSSWQQIRTRNGGLNDGKC